MNWTAVVPLKAPAQRKTRLGIEDPELRLRITEQLLGQVLAALRACPMVSAIVLLAPVSREGVDWLKDERRGLNAELAAARGRFADMLVVHADLPLVTSDDLRVLLELAERHGGAIAPDRHGLGTNAVAIRAATAFSFCFGSGSRHRHAAQLPPGACAERPGLALDVDTLDDWQLATSQAGAPQLG